MIGEENVMKLKQIGSQDNWSKEKKEHYMCKEYAIFKKDKYLEN